MSKSSQSFLKIKQYIVCFHKIPTDFTYSRNHTVTSVKVKFNSDFRQIPKFQALLENTQKSSKMEVLLVRARTKTAVKKVASVSVIRLLLGVVVLDKNERI